MYLFKKRNFSENCNKTKDIFLNKNLLCHNGEVGFDITLYFYKLKILQIKRILKIPNP